MIGDVELKLFISLFSLGLFGGLGHCGFMCGPFVLMQVNSNLKNIKIEDVSYLQKLRGLALIPYHFGRITTYSFLGLISGIIGKNIRNDANFHLISGIMLLIGVFFILNLFLKNFDTDLTAKIFKKNRKGGFFDKIFNKIMPLLDNLFKNPKGFNGYLLGIILGFIPCGLLYSALIIAATFDNYLFSSLAMLIFGIGTTPTLLLSGAAGYLFFSKLKTGFKLLTQFILLINMIVLFIIALSQIGII